MAAPRGLHLVVAFLAFGLLVGSEAKADFFAYSSTVSVANAPTLWSLLPSSHRKGSARSQARTANSGEHRLPACSSSAPCRRALSLATTRGIECV